ncbi:MAG: Luciferase-like, subgroup [Nevskia sp.]|nr:Luciferase-like, subgroup [Nevskia sp.]
MAVAALPQFGVFLPIANGGWIISKTRPPIDASYALNRRVAKLAEKLDFDFILSMAKWKGYGGETEHWHDSMESITLMSALAEATEKIKVWCTLHTLVHNPAVAAKMAITLDHISGGRAGINVVAGAYRGEFEQMGLWRDDLSHDDRYVLAREWLQIVKKLWAEDHVNYDGRFFQMKDCEMHPKPLSKPRPHIVCAGMSEVGMRFSAEEADACFIGGRDEDEVAAVSRRAKAIAAETGNPLKTFAMYCIVPGDTDADAEARAQSYIDGVDVEAVRGMMKSYGLLDDGRENSMVARSKQAFMSSKFVGSRETIAKQIVETIRHADLDGMMLIFPDFEADLKIFGEEILPAVRKELGR